MLRAGFVFPSPQKSSKKHNTILKMSCLILIYFEIIPSTKEVKNIKVSGEVRIMKGYITDCGYMGYLDGAYQLFADEADYREAYYEENVD